MPLYLSEGLTVHQENTKKPTWTEKLKMTKYWPNVYKLGYYRCNCIIVTYFTGFFGIVFESDRETGYSIQRLWQAVAFSVLFVCSIFFNTLWLLLALFIITMPMFLVAEWKYSAEMKNSFPKCSGYNKRCVFQYYFM